MNNVVNEKLSSKNNGIPGIDFKIPKPKKISNKKKSRFAGWGNPLKDSPEKPKM